MAAERPKGATLPPGGRWIFRPDKGGTKKTEEEFGRITPDTGNRSDLLTGYDFKSLMHFLVLRLPPAFLFSQKSKIFDSFPPGEALAACGRKLYDKLKFERSKRTIFHSPYCTLHFILI